MEALIQIAGVFVSGDDDGLAALGGGDGVSLEWARSQGRADQRYGPLTQEIPAALGPGVSSLLPRFYQMRGWESWKSR